MRVVESGLDVIGMGEEKTAESFINACTIFKFVGVKQETPSRTSEKTKQKKAGVHKEPEKKHIQVPKKVVMAIQNAIINSDTDTNGWVQISLIGEMLHNRFPDFDPRIWGAKSTQLSGFLLQLEDFEVEAREGKQPNAPNYYIRIK
ncbi:MAG: OST-HTH/LOTUS domain-containing protein, partial [Clostridiales Family XIII bacterium]|jgi:Fe-S-cluster formation regulator IscX/YfhJ|nr:OST-HTH/LOTUS domain-containing protein [Clostridiales Family XIII bacterium]